MREEVSGLRRNGCGFIISLSHVSNYCANYSFGGPKVPSVPVKRASLGATRAQARLENPFRWRVFLCL